MVHQGKWDDVAIITLSDFGRTITSNGKGSDHGWGGMSYIMGGKVKGGRILGQYPHDISESSPYFLGRGRAVPTTPWESLWHGVADWLGVPADKMSTILPNYKNFPGDLMWTKDDLFKK